MVAVVIVVVIRVRVIGVGIAGGDFDRVAHFSLLSLVPRFASPVLTHFFKGLHAKWIRYNQPTANNGIGTISVAVSTLTLYIWRGGGGKIGGADTRCAAFFGAA